MSPVEFLLTISILSALYAFADSIKLGKPHHMHDTRLDVPVNELES